MLPPFEEQLECRSPNVSLSPPSRIALNQVCGSLAFGEPVRGTAYKFDLPSSTVTIGFWRHANGSHNGDAYYDAICDDGRKGTVSGDLTGADLNELGKGLFLRAAEGSWPTLPVPTSKVLEGWEIVRALQSIDADAVKPFHPTYFTKGQTVSSTIEALTSHFLPLVRAETDYGTFQSLAMRLGLPLHDVNAIGKVLWTPSIPNILKKLAVAE